LKNTEYFFDDPSVNTYFQYIRDEPGIDEVILEIYPGYILINIWGR